MFINITPGRFFKSWSYFQTDYTVLKRVHQHSSEENKELWVEIKRSQAPISLMKGGQLWWVESLSLDPTLPCSWALILWSWGEVSVKRGCQLTGYLQTVNEIMKTRQDMQGPSHSIGSATKNCYAYWSLSSVCNNNDDDHSWPSTEG